MIVKRFNMLRYYDAFGGYDVGQIETIIYSLLEHTISDLGYDIELRTEDLRPHIPKVNQEMDKIISDVVEATLLFIPSSYKVDLITVTPYIFEVHLH